MKCHHATVCKLFVSPHNADLLCSLSVLRQCFTLMWQGMDTVVRHASLMAEGKPLGPSHFSVVTNTGDMPYICTCPEHWRQPIWQRGHIGLRAMCSKLRIFFGTRCHVRLQPHSSLSSFSYVSCFCSPPGPPGGRRRMGRITHGAGPNPPPMGGGGWGRWGIVSLN